MVRGPEACIRCGRHPIRSNRAIARELVDVVGAVGHLARIDAAEQNKLAITNLEAKGETITAGVMWHSIESVMLEYHLRGLADELLGYCVFCAHIMDPERRAALQEFAGATR